MSHIYETRASWAGSWTGQGKITARNLEASYSLPEDLKGLGQGTNPEELFLAAAGSCFLIAYGISLSFQKVAVKGLTIHSRLTLETEGGLAIKRVDHYPTVQTTQALTAEEKQAVAAMIPRAEAHCLITKAVAGNVKVVVDEPTFEVVP